VFLIASDKDASINATLTKITTAFGKAITETHRISGAARPGVEVGHERTYRHDDMSDHIEILPRFWIQGWYRSTRY
jgi:hypothetical protein